MRPWFSVVGVLACGLVLLLAGCSSLTPTAVAPTSEPTAVTEATATDMPSIEATATTVSSAGPTEELSTSPLPTGSANSGGNADVLSVRAVQDVDGTWTFHVTVEHPDTGWEDYADGWDVVTPDSTVLKPDPDSQFTRTLLHPHEAEQPFTRSQGGIEIPEGVTEVRVRAHDLVDGFGGQEVVVDLTAESGPNFEVVRQ